MSLSAGDWVEVRAEAEILATLDAHGQLDQLPFMPEMFEFCGKRFKVWKRAHKTCDTVNRTGGRRMEATVHLQELRCNGAAHGGCEAACLMFWKEAWLKPVAGPQTAASAPATPSPAARVTAGKGCSRADVVKATRVDGGGEAEPVYSCQATTLPAFTTPLKWWDFRQYLEDWTSGNWPFSQLIAGGSYVFYHWLVNWTDHRSPRWSQHLIDFYDRFQARRGGSPYPRRRGTIPAGEKTPARLLNLEPGERVRVRPLNEVLATLDTRNRNRGMFFDAEEVPFCGKTYTVRSKVERIIDERSGRMIALKGQNVILDNVWCQARYSDRRMLCPRAIYPFWRETWLERVPEADVRSSSSSPQSAAKQAPSRESA